MHSNMKWHSAFSEFSNIVSFRCFTLENHVVSETNWYCDNRWSEFIWVAHISYKAKFLQISPEASQVWPRGCENLQANQYLLQCSWQCSSMNLAMEIYTLPFLTRLISAVWTSTPFTQSRSLGLARNIKTADAAQCMAKHLHKHLPTD